MIKLFCIFVNQIQAYFSFNSVSLFKEMLYCESIIHAELEYRLIREEKTNYVDSFNEFVNQNCGKGITNHECENVGETVILSFFNPYQVQKGTNSGERYGGFEEYKL